MRILHAIHDFLPRHQAGSEIYAFDLCRALAAQPLPSAAEPEGAALRTPLEELVANVWSAVLGVELRLSDFVKQAPDWMDHIGALTGTVFIGNHPPTFAIGHLADQKTWLLLHLDYDLWVRTFFEIR